MRDHPKVKELREGVEEEYSVVIESQLQIIESAKNRCKSIENPPLRHGIEVAESITRLVYSFSIGIFLFFWWFDPLLELLYLIPVAISFGFLSSLFKNLGRQLNERIKVASGPELHRLREQIELANNRIISTRSKQEDDFRNRREKLWSSSAGYPPDWDLRRYDVHMRDGYACTECGWPNGFKVRRRELHVHHIIPVSRGGDSSLDNLITLCHICHSKVDSLHKVVRPLTRARMANRRRRRT